METPPPSKIGRDKDRISSLPDELILGILERLHLRDAVRAGAVSRRWRHLPHQLSRVDLDVRDFQGTTPLDTMDAFTGAVCSLLSACPPAERKCDCKSRRAVKILRLHFYPSAPHLSSIGRAVEVTVSRGETDCFEFNMITGTSDMILLPQAKWGQQFMSFSHACPISFRWLTGLSLRNLVFGDSDLSSLIGACDKLKHLLVAQSVLKIDVPKSAIQELNFISCKCMWIELVSVPMLREVMCRSWSAENPPLRFGYVPKLRMVTLGHHAGTWQAPFALSECFSLNTRNLTKLDLNFSCQMIWIQPEHPKQLTSIFRNLTDVELWNIFPECDLSWTLFILQAAPVLRTFLLDRSRHSCVEASEKSAEKANVVWEPSKDLKHLNLRLLVMIGFEEEDKVTNYIRLIMELAAGLKTIQLRSHTCEECNAIDLEAQRINQTDESSRHQIKERLAHASLSVEIILAEGCGH